MKKDTIPETHENANESVFPTSDAPPLTIILAIRTSDFSLYESRLQLRDRCDLSGVSTVVVDDGCSETESQRIKSFCRARNWRYVYIDSGHSPFSLSRARNAGLQMAESEWIYIDDADMAYPEDFFQKLIDELFLLDQTPFNFLTIPAVYLTADATSQVQETAEIDSHIPWLLSRTLLENPRGSPEGNSAIQSFSPASAMLAMRRKTALTAGAYDTAFEGWGGEDRDFVFRLLALNTRLAKPKKFADTKNWSLNDTHCFEGWRSLYRLLGEYMTRKGFYAFHLFHQPNAWREPKSANRNFEHARQKAIDYSERRKIPCISVKSRPRDVIIGFNPFITDPKVRETLGNPEIIDEDDSRHPDDFAAEVLRSPVNSVIMWNPYKKEWRLRVLNALRELGVSPIVAERGALPNSIYFDANGLCILSDSYSEVNWTRKLSTEEAQRTKEYIDGIRFGDKALEAQSRRIGATLLASQLTIPPDTKILFAPLQLLDDTVTSLFTEEGRDYPTYLRELERLSQGLPRNWILVYKNHPLSLVKVNVSSGVCADKYHINDILEACDAVVVYNSGTGLLAQAFNKRVFYFGKCFYAIDGVNSKFESIEGILTSLSNLVPPDSEKILRFYHFLRYAFYSFAEMRATTKPSSKVSRMSKLQKIDYEIIRIPGFEPREFATDSFDLYYSPLFDAYRFHAIADRGAAEKRTAVEAPVTKHLRNSKSDKAVTKVRVLAKWNKLRRNPSAFFRDSRIPPLRVLQYVFQT
jgi:predicted glycosyltransferase involved in capsule biosynthesis